MILHAEIYFPEEITKILETNELKYFAWQFNLLKVDDDRIIPMEKFADTTTEISLKNHHTWGCPVYVLYARLQGNIAEPHKW